jgi:hypothetical protein
VTALRSYLRLSSIALAAIVGMLSVAGEAVACSAKDPGAGARSCCASPSRSACCCEAEKAEPGPPSIERTAVGLLSGSGHLLAPNSPCECRTGGPNEPAPKPQSPTSERRTDQERARSFESILEFCPTTIFFSLIPPTESPPGVPLYLRSSRLLI